MKSIFKLLPILLLFLSSEAFPQFISFGRNKVQYDDFNWKVIKTDHFDIYFYDDLEEIAEIGSFYAEEAYLEYKEKLNHTVNRKIPLIFYNTSLHFQQTNTTAGFIPEGVGGFFEFLKGRVVIPYTGSLNDFKHVIRHELAHVFMTNKLYVIQSNHRLPPENLPPLWFVEGFAEYMSTTPDDQAEMIMRDAIINGYFTGLANINLVYGSFIMYKEGQSFLEFVRDNYGKEKVLLILENFWLYTNFTKVLEYVLDEKIEDIDYKWTFSLRKKYFPLFKDKLPQKINSQKLTKGGGNFSPVYYEYEGKRYVYFQANLDGYSSLYKIQVSENRNDEFKPERVVRGEKEEELESFHLYNSSIDISKDGIVAFVTKSGATDAIHLYSIKDDNIFKNIQTNKLISISSPKFSSDDNKLVFNAIDQKGFSNIYLYHLTNDSLEILTNDFYDDRDPVFSGDDQQIIFSSDRIEHRYSLFTYDIQSNKVKPLLNIKANSFMPSLSKDKKGIVFTSDIDSVHNIYYLNLEDRKLSKVTNFFTNVFNPVFQDSSNILFSGFEELSFNIYSIPFTDTSLSEMNYKTVDETKNWYAPQLDGTISKKPLEYENEYTLDYAQSQIDTDPIFGTRGGAVFSISDLFGNENYNFLIYNSADVQSEILKSFNVMIQKIDLSQRANYGYGVFHFAGRRYDIRDTDEYYYERSFGSFFLLHFPLSKYSRIETSVSLTNSDKEVIQGVRERKAILVGNNISYVFDNSLWGYTGPLDGIRARLLLGFTGDIKYSNVNYYSIIADYRQYFRLGMYSAIAFRSAIFYNHGKEARRYFMGGSWDLRGWNRWSIRGEKMWISSMELRFPLIDYARIKFPLIDLGFPGIRGAAFIDAGSAWDDEYETTYGSMGAGIRINVFGFLTLRYDIGKKITNDFTKLQKGLFYQFFFGWDF